MSRILVVDDEKMIRFAFEEFLKDEGHTPFLSEDAGSAIEKVLAEKPEIVFLDYRLPGRDGLSLLEEILSIDPTIAVVFMTAFGTMDVVIKAMQQGAHEYLTKPLDLVKVREVINNILKGRQLSGAGGRRKASAVSASSHDRIVGTSPVMQEIFKMIGLLTGHDITVLITEESGVGKELVARAIHDNSARRELPFIAVNCGAMPENLLESEMFGYEKGAFTGADTRKQGKFEAAGMGSIFLDEIGELQPSLQVKLLRVLQDGAFDRVGGNTPVHTDARIIAATNKDLHAEMISGHFRTDLFYRLYLAHINIPPLRERREDIPLLVDHFIEKANLELGRRVQGLTETALKRFIEYSWSGNVRELENSIKSVMVLSRENVLTENLFKLDPPQGNKDENGPEECLVQAARQILAESSNRSERNGSVFSRALRIVEKSLLEEALHMSRHNQARAAQMLGIHRSTLRKKVKDHGI